MLLQTRKEVNAWNKSNKKQKNEKMNKKKHRRKTKYEKNTQKKILLTLSFWQISKRLQ